MRFFASWLASVAVGVVGCGANAGHAPEQPETIVMSPLPTLDARLAPGLAIAALVAPTRTMTPPPVTITEQLYGADVHAVELVAATLVRKAPETSADKLGVIGKQARAAVVDTAPASAGCATRWLAIAPRGWICETATTPSAAPPSAATEVELDEDDRDGEAAELVGTYGAVRGREVPAYASRADAAEGIATRVISSATSVRAKATTTIAGRRYWITTGGELIDAGSIAAMSPSRYRGVALEDGLAAPLAWTHNRAAPRKPVAMRAAPSPRAAITGELPPRTVLAITETSSDGRFVRISDIAWVARADLRVAQLAEPPAGTGPREHWFDIDLDEQVLVAYEGARPVYATLVSTGKRDRRTPSSIARVVSKHERTNMTSDKQDVYAVADVPWTMFYDHNFALHTAYWHDGFGDVRSHGCVNLAPRDARLLYHWSSPDVPAGWTTVYGDLDVPGSLVRVRSRETPAPAFRGYARALKDRSTLAAN